MELAMSYDLVKLLHASRFHVNDIVDLSAVLNMPQVHSQVIRREEVFTVWRKAQRVDVILVSTAVLSFAPAFPAFINHF